MTLPTDEEFWSKERPGLPDIKFLKDHFYREGRLTEEQALFILEKGTEILKSEPNLLEVGAPITGKLHSYVSWKGQRNVNCSLISMW